MSLETIDSSESNQSYLDKPYNEMKMSKVNSYIEKTHLANSGGARKVVSGAKTLLKQDYSKDRLSCLYINATSLNNKIDELLIEIIRVKANIILISETLWTDESAVIIPGLNLYRKDRVSSKGSVFISRIKLNLTRYKN